MTQTLRDNYFYCCCKVQCYNLNVLLRGTLCRTCGWVFYYGIAFPTLFVIWLASGLFKRQANVQKERNSGT